MACRRYLLPTGVDRVESRTERKVCRVLALGGAGLLALLGLLVPLLALATSPPFTSGQNASLVLGQPTFTSSAIAVTQSETYLPHGVVVDAAGRLWGRRHL